MAGDSAKAYPVSSPNSVLAKQPSAHHLASQLLATEKEYICLSAQAFSAV